MLANTVHGLARQLSVVHGSLHRSLPDGGSILSRIGTPCEEWMSIDNAERTRRLIVTLWDTNIRWSELHQEHLQSLIDAIDQHCASQEIAPAGQVVFPIGSYSYGGYPYSASYWFGQTGYPCAGWASLGYYEKMSALRYTLSNSGQRIDDASIGSLLNDIDTYCAGIGISSSFLSPYLYRYSPYGYGYNVPYAFPFIVRSSFFRFGGGSSALGGGPGNKR